MRGFIEELRYRNVFRVATAYIVAGWLIAQAADLAADAFNAPDWVMKMLIVVLLIGLPVAMFLAWAYELTPEGVKRAEDLPEDMPQNPRSKSQLNRITLIALVVAVAWLGWDKLQRPAAEVTDKSIAVLPFVNMSDDPGNEYFSDGLSEELLNMLAGIEELRVTARTSSFAFKNEEIDIPTIAQRLNVANVLEGSVRKSGNHIRITAQLIDAASGYHLWSETYDRTLDDIFEVQDEIAAAVVDALRLSLLGDEPRVRQTTPEAFSAYLQALHFYQQRTQDSYLKSVQYAQQAVDFDPEYVPAWTLLGASYSNLALTGDLLAEESYLMALTAVERALEIDADFALANSARAWIAMSYERDFATAAAFFRRAEELAPGNSIILGNKAILALILGHTDSAIELTTRGIELNPISTTGYINLADQLTRAGRHVDAIAAASKALELTPGSVAAQANLALAYVLAEQPEEALAAVERTDWRFFQLFTRALAHHDLGNTRESDEAFTSMIDEYFDSRAFYIATAFAWTNDVDSAFEWLQRAADEEQPMLGIRTDPFLASLHNDARWNLILTESGLSDDDVAKIEF
jgi:adenylate cyclase